MIKGIVKLYLWAENIWFGKIPEKLRFLLVGGFNTSTSFLLYYTFLYFTNGREQLSLLLMNIININISIATMRYYVFRSHGSFWVEYQKAFGSYIALYFFNIGLLHFFVSIIKLKENISPDNILYDVPNLNKAVAQICCICITTVVTFFVHKYFSFRKKEHK
jgi:putative flippase GtrA